MLDLKFIRENKKLVEKNCQDRQVKVNVGALLALDEKRRDLLKLAEEKRALRNQSPKASPVKRRLPKCARWGGN